MKASKLEQKSLCYDHRQPSNEQPVSITSRRLRTGLLAAACTSLLATALPASAALVTSRAGLAGTDFIDWGQLGGSFTTVVDPVTVTTNLGLTAMVSMPGGANMERRDQNNGWGGNFAGGDKLLWTLNSSGPITIDFATGLSAIGAQIQANFFGAFDGLITAYDSSNNILESYSVQGNSNSNGDNSAIFIGIQRSAGDIDHVEFAIANGNGPDFAINQVDLQQVPEPGSLALAGLAFVGTVLTRRRKTA